MFKKIVFLLTSVFLLLTPALVHADGGIMPPPDHWVYETGQKAAIVYQDKIETLVLSTSFAGDAKDFAYIVPTPSQPEVSKVSDDIFSNLEELTQVTQNAPSFGAGGLGAGEMAVENKVTVLEEKQVGIFDVKVLSATDANALYDWLKENNFTYPESKKYILDDYIKNNWFFTTAKISTEAITGDIESKLQTGELTPLKFVFQTDNMVFPLKISAVIDDDAITDSYEELEKKLETLDSNSDEYMEIMDKMIYQPVDSVPISLYIFSDHKKSNSKFTPVYANWIKKDEIEKLAKDDNGNHWVDVKGKKMYLTYLSGTQLYSEMTNDLFFDNAGNNDKVGVANWWESDFGAITIILIFLALLILFFILCIWQFKPASHKCHVTCWTLQIIGFIFAGLPMLFVALMLLVSSSFSVFSYGSLTEIATALGLMILFAGIPALMIILMVMEKHRQKKMKEGK